MIAAHRFIESLASLSAPFPGAGAVDRIRVSLHGSLAFTGKGHATDNAVILGLMGELPDCIEPDAVPSVLKKARSEKSIQIQSLGTVRFDPDDDLTFDYGAPLPGHANGMIFTALDQNGAVALSQTYYSIGGGFVLTDRELEKSQDDQDAGLAGVPYAFATAAAMLEMGNQNELTIAQMKRANEETHLSADELTGGLSKIWTVMNDCIDRGISEDGILPGGLNVRRRAPDIYRQLRDGQGLNSVQPHQIVDWISLYAMAVNEENAAGGRVVTAPTNGAAGVIPAVIRYYRDHCIGADGDGVETFLLTAAAIGGIIKHNASISGAEVGCQGEVGSASAMAAAGLCAALGGTNEQIENAAEIALEHHLGMTCDPVAGLVQVPCIERNALGAVKAVTSASLALRGEGEHFVPLDTCVETMRQTGLDMSDKYKETSTGGLAVNAVAC